MTLTTSPVRLDTDSRTRLYADMTLDIDPDGATVEIQVDGTWHPATWQGTSVRSGKQWRQAAITTGYFAGPTATANGATVLGLGGHPTKTRVTKAGDVLTASSGRIDVQ